jgi:Dihaem cytochrome c
MFAYQFLSVVIQLARSHVMPKFLRMAVLSAAVCGTLGAGPAAAVDDRFNPHKYEKGGFAPAGNPTYVDECGACHFTYLPGLLPERSWRALMAKANNDHFGESLSLSPDVAREIEQYLVSNAADTSERLGAQAILYRLRRDVAPLRITSLPVFRARHFMAAYVKKATPRASTARTFPPAAIKVLMNCNDCHEKAATGSFAYEEIIIPGVTKVVKPGGMF